MSFVIAHISRASLAGAAGAAPDQHSEALLQSSESHGAFGVPVQVKVMFTLYSGKCAMTFCLKKQHTHPNLKISYYLKTLSISCWKNGTNKLALCRVSTTPQFVKLALTLYPKEQGILIRGHNTVTRRALLRGPCFILSTLSSFFFK